MASAVEARPAQPAAPANALSQGTAAAPTAALQPRPPGAGHAPIWLKPERFDDPTFDAEACIADLRRFVSRLGWCARDRLLSALFFAPSLSLSESSQTTHTCSIPPAIQGAALDAQGGAGDVPAKRAHAGRWCLTLRRGPRRRRRRRFFSFACVVAPRRR